MEFHEVTVEVQEVTVEVRISPVTHLQARNFALLIEKTEIIRKIIQIIYI